MLKELVQFAKNFVIGAFAVRHNITPVTAEGEMYMLTLETVFQDRPLDSEQKADKKREWAPL